MSAGTAFLGEIMVEKQKSIDPKKHAEENFALYSIPGYDAGSPEYCKGAEIGSSKKCLEPGDVILSRIIPHIRRAWVVGDHDVDRIVGSSEWIVFRSTRFYGPFLRHILTADPFHAKFMNTVAGVGGSLVRARPKAAAGIEIPLPPLEEQRRIAGILDAADALRRRRKDALALLDTLPGAIFAEMFGDRLYGAGRNEKPVPLSEVAHIQSGITKGRKLKLGEPTEETPYLAVANVQDKRLDLGNVKTIEATAKECARYALASGDLLLTEGGDPDKLGRGTVWNDEIPGAIHQNHIFRVRVSDASVQPIFLSHLLSSPHGRGYFLRMAKQTTGIASINKTQLSAFPAILPDESEQVAFVERLQSYQAIKDQLVAHLNELEVLFASLQSRAFAGEL